MVDMESMLRNSLKNRIYAVYRAWAEENGERYPLGQKKFSTELVDNHRFFRRKTMRFSEFLDVEFSAIGREYQSPAWRWCSSPP